MYLFDWTVLCFVAGTACFLFFFSLLACVFFFVSLTSLRSFGAFCFRWLWCVCYSAFFFLTLGESGSAGIASDIKNGVDVFSSRFKAVLVTYDWSKRLGLLGFVKAGEMEMLVEGDGIGC